MSLKRLLTDTGGDQCQTPGVFFRCLFSLAAGKKKTEDKQGNGRRQVFNEFHGLVLM
jgi:hypothetical protein